MHYQALKDQLKADLAAVLSTYGGSPRISFGRPRKPISSYPQAIVRTVLEREVEGRSVEESYGFVIDLRLPLPASGDAEDRQMEAADALTMRLAPYAVASVPDPPEDYGGVGYLPQVTSIVPGEDEDTNDFCSVKLGFSVRTTVHQ